MSASVVVHHGNRKEIEGPGKGLGFILPQATQAYGRLRQGTGLRSASIFSRRVYPAITYHAGFASSRALAQKESAELPAISMPASVGTEPKTARLIAQKCTEKARAYSEALSAEAQDALRQAVKQLRKTIFSAEQLR